MTDKKKYFIDQTIYKGRPEDISDRLKKEVAVYNLLDSLGIEYQRIDHEPIYTIDGCEELDKLLGIKICKNLFLCNRQKTKFYLLMIPGKKKFFSKIFSKAIGSARLSFAPEEYLEEFLDITPGSVSVMGLMNDRDKKVELYIDSDILKEEYFVCHPCINTSSLKIKVKDLTEKMLPATGHEFHSVTMPWECPEE